MKKLAIYLRLSLEDGDVTNGDKLSSNSIENQRKLILDYLSKHKELMKYEMIEFVDDGYSGTNFNRPGFIRMMELAKKEEIATIITKDFSRLGRDYLEVGNYLEYIFPLLQIQYISVNDAFDSSNCKGMTGGMSVALKNIINSMYSEDLSKKVSAAQTIKAKNGDYIHAQPPYGYLRDENDNHKIVIEPEAAAVIRLIFNLAEQGKGYAAIARELNSRGIPSITQYYTERGITRNINYNGDKTLFWSGSVISNILVSEIYAGTMIWGKTDQSLRTKRNLGNRVIKDKKEWIVIENHHEAIINRKQYDHVQEIVKERRKKYFASRTKATTERKKNLCKCPYCNRTMADSTNRLYCSTQAVSLNEECKKAGVSKKDLEKAVLYSINQIAELVVDTSKKRMKIRDSCDIMKAELDEVKKTLESIPDKKLQAYSSYKAGNYTIEQYQIVVSSLMENKAEFEQKHKLLENEIEKLTFEEQNKREQEEYLTELSCIKEFDSNELSKFIKCIYVYAPDKIEIEYKFDDIFQK